MDANVIRELQNGLNAAYINGSVAVNLAYKPLDRYNSTIESLN